MARLITIIGLAFLYSVACCTAGEPARNIVFFIGDGMGFEQVKAAACYMGTNLSFESFPFRARQTTLSDGGATTDSAAGGTAIATGRKVANGTVSVALPGNGSSLHTLLEYMKTRGKRTGLVTTTDITDATPAAFGAHATNRSESTTISEQYLYNTRPNILFGGTGGIITPANASAAGYTVLSNSSDLQAVNTETSVWVSGQFGAGAMPYEYDGIGNLPHLSDMTEKALQILDNEPLGFFLMVEGGRIDHACHAMNIQRSIWETREFSRAVERAINWAAGREDTLIVVTADHETGGLLVLANNGVSNYPSVSWEGSSHTTSHVPVYAWGPGSEYVTNILDNTNHFAAITAAAVEPASDGFLSYVNSNRIDISWTGVSGSVFKIESKRSIFEPAWSNMATTTATMPTVIISDTNISAENNRYYRIRPIP